MKINKKYIKFHEIGDNRYYLLPFDGELFIGTESVLSYVDKVLFFKRKRKLSQGFKLLQLTSPIFTLFNEIICCDIEKEDEDFPDMNTYKKVDNKQLRKNIEKTYKDILDTEIDNINDDFQAWVDDLVLNNEELSEEEINKVIIVNTQRVNELIKTVKAQNILNSLSFKWNNGENLIIKKMLDNNMEFLYSHKFGAGYKIYYLYELDDFGTVTIYKVQCVKDVVKSVETFIYNREIIQELTACMVNNDL